MQGHRGSIYALCSRKHFMSTADMPNGDSDIAKLLTLCHLIHLVSQTLLTSSWMVKRLNMWQYSSLSCGYHVTQNQSLVSLDQGDEFID
jgi:hypothetical protein